MKEKITALLLRAWGKEIAPELQVPEGKHFGHYATSVALKLANTEKKNPMEIAERLKNELLRVAPAPFFKKIEVTAPGFINMWLSEETFHGELKEILKKKEKYGRSTPTPLGGRGSEVKRSDGLSESRPRRRLRRGQTSRVQVEFISANPTGPLTLANGRGGFLGDVIANLLEYSGHKVEREYYVNDTGNQIITLGKSLAAAEGIIPQEDHFYKGAYIKEWAQKNKATVKKLANTPLELGARAANNFFKVIKKTIEQEAGIHFDRYTREASHIHKKGFVKKVQALFEKKGLTYTSEGALWLKTTEFGDDKDRVLVTRDGFPTYFCADAGHYLETKTRGFNRKLLILGPDHYGYVKRIEAAAKIIGLAQSEIIITQAVRLMRDGTEVKMSKRTGEFVTFKELLDEIPRDAVRFFFLMYAPSTHMDFDMNAAKERSMKNPVYYAQYAAVRAGGILKKAKSLKLKAKSLDLLTTEADINLMRMLIRFPEIIESATTHYSPQILARYTLDLAREFNNFYEKERILPDRGSAQAERKTTQKHHPRPSTASLQESARIEARLALVTATHIIFKTTLKLLGITFPKKM